MPFAPGAHETTAGAPHWPISAHLITNGACAVHSSGLTEDTAAFYEARTKYVVGSSKAAIDILETLDPEDERVVWAHRGHIVFHNRDRMHWGAAQAAPASAETIERAHTGNLFLKFCANCLYGSLHLVGRSNELLCWIKSIAVDTRGNVAC